MKLAEALQERADLVKIIERLKERIRLNATAPEGENPSENPLELLKELDGCIDRFSYLAARINKTNNEIKIGNLTITEVIAKKDALITKVSAYRDFVFEAGSIVTRVRGTEIKIVPTINVAEVQKEIDKFSKEIRQLDNSLQSTNWTAELLED